MKGWYHTMANTIKVTKVDTFNAIVKAFAEMEIDTLEIKGEQVSIADFCNHEIELIQKKSASKKTVDNSGYFELVENALANGALTPTELMAKIGVANTQKVSAIVKGMSNVEKTVKGKKVFYSLAE